MQKILKNTLFALIAGFVLTGCTWTQTPLNLQGHSFTLNTSGTDPVLMQLKKTLRAYNHGTDSGPKATFSHEIKSQILSLSPDGQDRIERLSLKATLTIENQKPISTLVYQDRLVNQNQKLADDAEVVLIKAELAQKAILQLLREIQNAGV